MSFKGKAVRQTVSYPKTIKAEKTNHTTMKLTSRVVLQVEPIKAMEGVIGMHIQRVNAQIIGSQIQRHKHLPQRQEAPIAEDHGFIGVLLELVLDEAQQVLLVHAGAVVHVSVHLTAVVEVAVRHRLLRLQFTLQK